MTRFIPDHPLRSPEITRTEGALLRGMAIIGIVLHNYCHWLGSIVRENEYTFRQGNVDGLLSVLQHPDSRLPLHLLSFFGHYGVPIFLFLSAYGLEKKYAGKLLQSPPRTLTKRVRSVLGFMATHYLKLFRLMAVGFAIFLLVDTLTPHPWHYDIEKIGAQLLMLNNLFSQPDRMIWPGPYWFFGLMMQFYLLYRLVLYRRHWAVTVVLIAVCVVMQGLLPPDGDAMNRYRYNWMGGMLPFGFGLLYARFEKSLGTICQTSIRLFVGVALCVGLVFAMSLNFVGWTFTPAIVCMGGLLLAKALTSAPFFGLLSQMLTWLGSISAALFVVHPIARKVIIPLSHQGHLYTGLLLYVVVSIILAWLLHQVIRRIPLPRLND